MLACTSTSVALQVLYCCMAETMRTRKLYSSLKKQRWRYQARIVVFSNQELTLIGGPSRGARFSRKHSSGTRRIGGERLDARIVYISLVVTVTLLEAYEQTLSPQLPCCPWLLSLENRSRECGSTVVEKGL